MERFALLAPFSLFFFSGGGGGGGEWRWGCGGGFAVPFSSVQDCRLPWVSYFCNLLHTKNSLKIRSTPTDHRKVGRKVSYKAARCRIHAEPGNRKFHERIVLGTDQQGKL